MKKIGSLATLAGLLMVAFALGATGARAQALSITDFAGTFTLPFDAQWGPWTLPAGEYSLYYGRMNDSFTMVEVVGKDKKSPHVLIPTQGQDDASATQSELICIREGNAGIVRTLEMPEIGQAVEFAMPHGTQVTAQRHNGSKNIELAQGPMLFQRIPVSLTSK